MSAARILRNTARVIRRHGETMTLMRTGHTDIVLKGKRFGGGTEDTGPSAVQQVFKVKIATTELLASAWASKVPQRTDRITVGGRARTVLDARPLGDGGVVALYELEVAG